MSEIEVWDSYTGTLPTGDRGLIREAIRADQGPKPPPRRLLPSPDNTSNSISSQPLPWKEIGRYHEDRVRASPPPR